ncbi:hypothetical protein [Mesorhizobium sp. WSM4982]|uniref:hypothetical protein n=1 Tax=Mesorhizobium sp. WSM4982 TaxID=3038550 RepID=UPI002415745E|nr:hypothetical protein [Mesorhizobium sp. WSM4982]MDG4856406.1 hypothetical protein [Mesorhizobium sp. WSM4982]
MTTIKAYLWLIILVAGLAVIGTIYAKGRLDAKHAAELASLQADIKRLTAQNAQLEAIQRQDQLQAMQDAEDKERLNALIDSQEALLADPHDGCLTADDVDRVRSVFSATPAASPKAGHTGGHKGGVQSPRSSAR